MAHFAELKTKVDPTGFTTDTHQVVERLDANDDWQAPITYPTITTYGSNDPLDMYTISWDEAGQKWTATDREDPVNNFNWDASALAWVSA